MTPEERAAKLPKEVRDRILNAPVLSDADLALMPPKRQQNYRKIQSLRSIIAMQEEPAPPDADVSPTGEYLRYYGRALPVVGAMLAPTVTETAPNPSTAASAASMVPEVFRTLTTVIPATALGGVPGLVGSSAYESVASQAKERIQENQAKARELYEIARTRQGATARAATEEMEGLATSAPGALLERVVDSPFRTAARTAVDTAFGYVGGKVGADLLAKPLAQAAFAGALPEVAAKGAGEVVKRSVAGLGAVAANPAARAEVLSQLPKVAGLGGALNAGQYVGQQVVEGRDISPKELLAEAVVGAGLDVLVGGALETGRMARGGRPKVPVSSVEPETTPEAAATNEEIDASVDPLAAAIKETEPDPATIPEPTNSSPEQTAPSPVEVEQTTRAVDEDPNKYVFSEDNKLQVFDWTTENKTGMAANPQAIPENMVNNTKVAPALRQWTKTRADGSQRPYWVRLDAETGLPLMTRPQTARFNIIRQRLSDPRIAENPEAMAWIEAQKNNIVATWADSFSRREQPIDPQKLPADMYHNYHLLAMKEAIDNRIQYEADLAAGVADPKPPPSLDPDLRNQLLSTDDSVIPTLFNANKKALSRVGIKNQKGLKAYKQQLEAAKAADPTTEATGADLAPEDPIVAMQVAPPEGPDSVASDDIGGTQTTGPDRYVTSPSAEPLKRDEIPETPETPKESRVWDFQAYTKGDTKALVNIPGDQAPVIADADLPKAAKMDSIGHVRAFLDIGFKMFDDAVRAFPVIRAAKQLFNPPQGGQTLGTYDSKNMQIYLSDLVGTIDDTTKQAFILLHELGESMNLGRFVKRKKKADGTFDPDTESGFEEPTVYQQITGSNDAWAMDANNPVVETIKDQAQALSNHYRGDAYVLDPKNPDKQPNSELEREKMRAYGNYRDRSGELASDARAAVMLDPALAKRIAPELTDLILRSMAVKHPRVSQAWLEYQRMAKNPGELDKRMVEALSEGTEESIRNRGLQIQADKDAIAPGAYAQVVGGLFNRMTVIKDSIEKAIGRKLTREEDHLINMRGAQVSGMGDYARAGAAATSKLGVEAERVGLTDEEMSQYVQLRSGEKVVDRLASAGLTGEQSERLLNDYLVNKLGADKVAVAEEWFRTVNDLKNEVFNRLYQSGSLGPVGSLEAQAKLDQFTKDWVAVRPLSKQLASGTKAPRSEAQGKGFLEPGTDPVMETVDAIQRLEVLAKTSEFFDSIGRTTEATLFYENPFGAYDTSVNMMVDGETRPRYTMPALAQPFTINSNLPTKVIDETLGWIQRVPKFFWTRNPFNVPFQWYRDFTSTASLLFMDKGLIDAYSYLAKFSPRSGKVRTLRTKGFGFTYKVTQAYVREGINGLDRLLKEFDQNITDIRKNNALVTGPAQEAIGKLTKARGTIAALRDLTSTGGVLQPGSGYVEGGTRYDTNPNSVARTRALKNPDNASSMTSIERLSQKKVLKVAAQYLQSYTEVLQIAETFSKFAGAMTAIERNATNGISVDTIKTSVDMAQRALEKAQADRIKTIENFNKGKAKRTELEAADEAVKDAMIAYQAERAVADKYGAEVFQAGALAGTPDIRLAGMNAPRIDNFMLYWAIAMKDMQRTFETVASAWNSGPTGKGRVAMFMSVPLAMAALREGVLMAMDDEQADKWRAAISTNRTKYSNVLPLGLMEWVDDDGNDRFAAMGISIPVPDAFRPFHTVLESALAAHYDEEAGMVDNIMSAVGEAVSGGADFVGPSVNPGIDLAFTLASVASGGNPTRGMNPLSRSRVLPEGAMVTTEEQRDALLNYAAQRTGLSMFLTKIGNDDGTMVGMPWIGSLRSRLFVEDTGLMQRKAQAVQAVQEKQNRQNQEIMAYLKGEGDLPEDATMEDVRRVERNLSKGTGRFASSMASTTEAQAEEFSKRVGPGAQDALSLLMNDKARRAMGGL